MQCSGEAKMQCSLEKKITLIIRKILHNVSRIKACLADCFEV